MAYGGLLLLAALAMAADAAGQGSDHWVNPAGGLFITGSNWQDGTRPVNDNAIFDLVPGSYTVRWESINTVNPYLYVYEGDVTFAAVGGDYTHSLVQGAVILGGRLTLRGESGGSFLLDDDRSIFIGRSGTLNVGANGSAWAGEQLVVGHLGSASAGEGRLMVHDGGSVDAGTLVVGTASPDQGYVVVSGGGSLIESGSVVVGDNGSGDLTVEEGGSLYTTEVTIGRGGASLGAASILGARLELEQFRRAYRRRLR